MLLFTPEDNKMLGTLIKATVGLRQSLTVQEYKCS